MTFAATPDLFTLGRDALAATKAAFSGQAFFAAVRRLRTDGGWDGPTNAAFAVADEGTLAATGGLTAAKQQGINAVLCDSANVALEAAAFGMRTVLRVPFSAGEPEGERKARLGASHATVERVQAFDAIVPVTALEPQGLDTLQFFAACRAAFPRHHIVADLELFGSKLGQLALSFGADELWGTITVQRALRLGEHASSNALTRDEAALLVRAAGFAPCERLAEGKVQRL